MKKRFNLFGLLMAVLGACLGIFDCSALMAGAPVVTDGAENAGEHVLDAPLDTVTTDEFSPELLEKAIDERVTKILPEDHIMDIIARTNGRSVSIQSLIYKYYSVDTLPNNAQVSVAITGQTAASGSTALLKLDNLDNFVVEDTIYVPAISGYLADGNVDPKRKLVLYVSAKDATGLTVQAVNGIVRTAGGRAVPNIAQGIKVYRMAKAAQEGAMRSSSYSVLPTPEENQCQIFQTEVSMTTIMAMHKKEVDWSFTDIEEMGMAKMLREMEASFRWGVKGDIYNANTGGTVHLTEGIINQIENSIEYDEANMTNNALLDICKQVFVGNNGAKKRIWLAGSDLINYIAKIPSVQKQIDSKESKIVWGLEWNEIRSNFGTLLLIHDTSLNEYGWADKGIIIDPNYLVKAYWKKLQKRALDTISSGQFDGKVTQLEEISCMVLKNKPCHFVTEPASATTITITTDNNLTFDNTASSQTRTVAVTNGMEWSVASNKAWCTVVKSGNSYTATVTANGAAGDVQRTATITITVTGTTVTAEVAVTQAGW